jgi:hypothetical protein
VSDAPRVPLNTDSTRSVHFRRLLGSSLAIVGGAIAAAIAFAIGASQQNAAIMIGGPLAVALAIVVICFVVADRHAEDEFFRLFADAHGLNHWKRWTLNGLTPLLAAGDRRHCKHWMEANGRSLGWYTYEVRQENGDKPDTWEPHHFTLAMVDIGEMGMGRFPGIYLRRRRGMFERLDTDADWLRRTREKQKIELESTAFCERYELWAHPDQDPIHLHQLFAPSFVLWLSEHPLEPGFELRAGTLTVFVPGHEGEAGKLQFLMMARDSIATRIQAELSEAAQAGSL